MAKGPVILSVSPSAERRCFQPAFVYWECLGQGDTLGASHMCRPPILIPIAAVETIQLPLRAEICGISISGFYILCLPTWGPSLL